MTGKIQAILIGAVFCFSVLSVIDILRAHDARANVEGAAAKILRDFRVGERQPLETYGADEASLNDADLDACASIRGCPGIKNVHVQIFPGAPRADTSPVRSVERDIVLVRIELEDHAALLPTSRHLLDALGLSPLLTRIVFGFRRENFLAG